MVSHGRNLWKAKNLGKYRGPLKAVFFRFKNNSSWYWSKQVGFIRISLRLNSSTKEVGRCYRGGIYKSCLYRGIRIDAMKTKGTQCLTSLVELLVKMAGFLNEGKPLNIIYLIFTKVFGIVFCNILVHMLGSYGLYRWMMYSQSGG